MDVIGHDRQVRCRGTRHSRSERDRDKGSRDQMTLFRMVPATMPLNSSGHWNELASTSSGPCARQEPSGCKIAEAKAPAPPVALYEALLAVLRQTLVRPE